MTIAKWSLFLEDIWKDLQSLEYGLIRLLVVCLSVSQLVVAKRKSSAVAALG